MTKLRRRSVGALLALSVAAVIVAPPAAAEAIFVRLGAAAAYAVVADQEIASVGDTTIDGDVAIAATSNLTGFPPGTIDGATHLADDEAIDAAGATATANAELGDQPCNSDRSGENQAGLRLSGAVYCYIEPAALDGELRLDALGDIDTVWVFQITGDYDVAAASQMILANGAQACNVFWQVSGAMTVADGAEILGTFIVQGDIVLGKGAALNGRVFAPQGTVQLNDNTITQGGCAVGSTTTTTANPNSTTTTPGSGPVATVPGGGTGDTGDGDGDGGGDGTGGDDGLAFTGPVSMVVVAMALATLGIGHALVGTERAVAWNRRRWRPRHARSRFDRWR